MYTNEQKKEMVEYGVKQFKLNPEFLNWLIDEFNIVYEKMLELKLREFKEKGYWSIQVWSIWCGRIGGGV